MNVVLRTCVAVCVAGGLTVCTKDDPVQPVVRVESPVGKVKVDPPAADPGRFVSWPLETGGPYETALSALFDHANKGWEPEKKPAYWPTKNRELGDKVVITNGLTGTLREGFADAPCGELEPNEHTGVSVASILRDETGIVYDGDCSVEEAKHGNGGRWLSYDNHYGVDVPADFNTVVLAPLSGWVTYQGEDPTGRHGADYHALTICQRPLTTQGICEGWRVRLLHLSSYWDGKKVMYAPSANSTDKKTHEECPVVCKGQGDWVAAGVPVAYSGDFSLYYGGTSLHLHIDVLDSSGVPRDPYGWAATQQSDPMLGYTNGPLWLETPPQPALPLSLPLTANIMLGYGHTCAADAGGRVYCWGRDRLSYASPFGRLGAGNSGDHFIPDSVHGGVRLVSLSGGDALTCGLEKAGLALCWGVNHVGGIGDGTTTDRAVPSQAASGLTFGMADFGLTHSCGIVKGVLYCWGWNGEGALGLGSPTNTTETSPRVVSGTSSVPSATVWKRVSTGPSYTCALDENGRAYCWGDPAIGHLGHDNPNPGEPYPVDTSLRFVDIGTGEFQTCGLTADGLVFCWASKELQWAPYGRTPTEVVQKEKIRHLSVGAAHVCATSIYDRGFCWGWGDDGRLGNGGPGIEPDPQEVKDVKFQWIVAGFVTSCGRGTDGLVYCWGNNSDGALGDGTTANRFVPTLIACPSWDDGQLAGLCREEDR